MAGPTLIGRTGVVTVRLPGGSGPGEVELVVQGMRHHYIAYCRTPVALGGQVLVIDERGSRQVDVEPWSGPGGLSRPGLSG